MSMRRSVIEGIVKALCRWRDVQVAFASTRVGERARFRIRGCSRMCSDDRIPDGPQGGNPFENSRCFGMSLTNVAYHTICSLTIWLCL